MQRVTAIQRTTDRQGVEDHHLHPDGDSGASATTLADLPHPPAELVDEAKSRT